MAMIRKTVTSLMLGLWSVGAWSEKQPDLAYLAVSEGYWQVWVADADGAHARQVTRTGYDKARVSWFPNRSLLVSGNEGRVLRVDLSGQETLIALEQYPVIDAVISPDGKRIAYSFSSAIDGNDIWIANADGSGAERLVRMAALQHEPAWPPRGEHVYFLSGDGGQAHDIWRVSLNGRNTEQLTVGTLYHFDVAVSGSGDLAYSSNRSGNYEIYLERPGARAEALTNHPALDARPAFAPDGSSILFESTRGGAPNLWRIDLQSLQTEQITHHRDGARAPAWYAGAEQ